ncbi:hypothetical protein SBOR_3379 [Sclerotinia borealis F-4128]|uniref:F-box domain-containing protein n=1 Tax=Sclerotinia borealis (strain F-4128) TaxID=1432307 RepID=W9CK27_SCLBF|nr:hypothetical protein SBOR_3379 [Sclerotinia borealis F-4128]
MESNSLSQVLDGMKLEDGTPNLNLRAAAIKQLLNSSTLNFGERRILKAHFDGIDFRHDIVANFPVELVTDMMEYLDLEDFMTMRCVSSKWRRQLSNPKIYRKPHFNVWSLVEEADPIVIHLECPYSILFSHNRQFVFGHNHTSRPTRDVHVWINGHIQKLAEPEFDVPDALNGSWVMRLCGFIFHPTEENHYFVFYQPVGVAPTNTSRIIVQEHIAGLLYKTWHQDLTSSGIPSDIPIFEARLIDEDGLVTLLCEIKTPALFTSPSSHEIFKNPLSGEPQLKFTTFNIITKEFGELANHAWVFAMIPRSLRPRLFWRGQVIMMYWECELSSLDPRTERYTKISMPNAQNPYALVSASVCNPYPAWGTFDYVGGARLASDKHRAAAGFRLPFLGDEEEHSVLGDIWGDDDFIIWSNRDGFCVWNFDPTVNLPTIDADDRLLTQAHREERVCKAVLA